LVTAEDTSQRSLGIGCQTLHMKYSEAINIGKFVTKDQHYSFQRNQRAECTTLLTCLILTNYDCIFSVRFFVFLGRE